uniref:Succinate dehydrogenase subunit 3 n=1 Tax=Pongamia pinnata TaxID=56065 RepID=G9JLN7_PONPI|nr:succinate dehydrogenase subunit 3 [Pongamia pinnata]YP_005090440.1 succinate dehydrogenase subunit 3 [Pongamia pinnata]AET62898.1 succinate dehydrogenase subunit 3 [Pongamia pinnata]AET62900.1 succinate dehydrogenase subunit 3 [Pongamia pinnata]
MNIIRSLLTRLPRMFHLFYSFLIIIPLLGVFYLLCLKLGFLDFFQSLLYKIGFSLGSRVLSFALLKLGLAGGLALAIGCLLRLLFSSEEIALFMFPPGADAGSEASVNQEPHHRPGPSTPIHNGSASTSSTVEQPAPPAKPYIALLQLEGERKRLIDEILAFVEDKLEDPGQPRGPINEQALRLLWNELEINESTSLGELQEWKDSLRQNSQHYKSIFGFYKPGGVFYEGNTPYGYRTY